MCIRDRGASDGAGLGHQFLRHLQRTRLLLHLVDIAPFDEGVDPVVQAKAIVNELKLELKVLADVGLLGMPNAGKSTLISAISNARPKIADYPFTTLHPNLGVVRVAAEQSFVVADVPGLIEGASDGAGLGHQFLRHLQRTRLLLHLVDIAPFDEGVDPVAQAKAIVNELKKYDKALYDKPRWIVLNKLDMVAADERDALVANFVKRMKYKGPVFQISALTREGCEHLIKDIYKHIKAQQVAEQPPEYVDPRFAEPTPE